jgi:hypothetical protein
MAWLMTEVIKSIAPHILRPGADMVSHSRIQSVYDFACHWTRKNKMEVNSFNLALSNIAIVLSLLLYNSDNSCLLNSRRQNKLISEFPRSILRWQYVTPPTSRLFRTRRVTHLDGVSPSCKHQGAVATKPSQLCDHASLLCPIHPIVHWLPNKGFAWPQSCEGFVNMAPDSQSNLRSCA